MSKDEILAELIETLSDASHKEYVRSYVDEGERGLSPKFDEFFELNIRET